MELLGPVAGLAAAACWAVASVMYARVPIGAGAMTTYKNSLATFFLAVALVVVALIRGEPMFQASLQSWWLLGVSGAIGLCLADIAYFRSIQILGPRQGLTLTLLIPPATALLGWWWLGETLSQTVWLAIGVTLFGIAVVMSEQAGDEAPLLRPGSRRWGMTCAFMSIGTMAVGAVFLRQGTDGVGTIEATFIRLFSASAFGLVLSVCMRDLHEIRDLLRDRESTIRLSSAAFLGTVVGVWLMVITYKYCLAGIAALLTSTTPLFVIPVVWLLLHHRISRLSIVGAAVAFAGVCALLLTQ